MKNYLAIIRRADFIDLYKYGCFYLDKEKIVEFDCKISDLPNKNDVYDALFGRMNSFESSFAYLIINYGKEDNSKDNSVVSIEEVKHVFPLDLEAKREFESSFDERIKIDNPIWNDAISLMKKKQMFYSSIQGARNVFNIFKLEGIDKCREIITDDIVEEMLSAVYDDVRPYGELPIWVYLMRYERHSFYPKDSLGYFMDVVHIIVNFMAKQEVDDYAVESTDIYKVLYTLEGKDKKSNEIMDYLKDDEGAERFLNTVSSFVPEIDFITTAINYLWLRDLYKEEFVYQEKNIEKCKTAYGECFALAAYMAGIAFSHDKTYSCFYETLPLAIYKSKEEMAEIQLRKQKEQERAKCEMERIEREREMEREIERERRKNGKKKGKKKGEYTPFGMSGYAHGRNGYSTYEPQSGEVFPPYNERDFFEPTIIPSKYANPEGIVPLEKQIDTPQPHRSLFPQEDMQEEEIRTRNLKFPMTLQRYTAKGKPSTAKNAIVEVKNLQEYKYYMEKKNEDWREKK